MLLSPYKHHALRQLLGHQPSLGFACHLALCTRQTSTKSSHQSQCLMQGELNSVAVEFDLRIVQET